MKPKPKSIKELATKLLEMYKSTRTSLIYEGCSISEDMETLESFYQETLIEIAELSGKESCDETTFNNRP